MRLASPRHFTGCVVSLRNSRRRFSGVDGVSQFQDTQVKLADARHARRTFRVVDVTEGGCWAEATKTAYVVPGTVLRRAGAAPKDDVCEASVGKLVPKDSPIFLQLGELLVLTRDLRPGRPATRDSGGLILTPAAIGCTIPEVFEDVRAGEAIWFDDGKLGGVIETVEASRVLVRIKQARWRGEKLRADKGINLPDSRPSCSRSRRGRDSRTCQRCC